MITIALILAITSLRLCETVDCIELNHQFDKHGKHVYDQVIFWQENAADGRFIVRAWCMADDDRMPLNSNGLCKVVWRDGNLVRYVSSRLYRESWTQIDPERENKKHCDESFRMSLARKIREVDCE